MVPTRLLAHAAAVFLAGTSGALAHAATVPHAAHAYHVVARWKIGGEGGWDYLSADPAARRLYVTHGTRVEVLDLDRGTRLGAITGTQGAHGIVLVPALHRGFVASGRDSAILAFDLESLRVVSRIAVPARFPDALLYEPASGRLFSFDGASDNACAFDARTGAFLESLSLGGTPEFAVTDGRGRVYVNIESTSELVAFDARTLEIERRSRLAPGEEPTGLAFDRAHGLLFSACGNRKLVVTRAATGRVVATVPIGAGVDGVVFDGARGTIVTSNGEGTLTVVRPGARGGFAVAETDSTQRGARTMALDEKTGRVFVVTAEFGPTPEATADRPHPRPPILPGTFTVLVLDR